MADEDTSGIESPFARVTSVVPGSPADEAGLEMEDRIKRFGDATWINHEKLNKIAETVHRNQGVSFFFDLSSTRLSLSSALLRSESFDPIYALNRTKS